ncbi:MAG: riboflavin kinase [Steroidobacteraceae bacterium]
MARLRDELRFDNLEQMVERMHVDAREARAVLGLAP